MSPVAERYSPSLGRTQKTLLSASPCVADRLVPLLFARKKNKSIPKKNSGAVATGEASLRYFVRVCSGMQGTGREGEVAGVDLHPTSSAPRSPALTWCTLPRSPVAGTFLLSGPGPAMRPEARRRARQASSSPRGGDAVWAVTMETAEAAPASEAAGRPAPRGQSVAREPAPSKPDL